VAIPSKPEITAFWFRFLQPRQSLKGNQLSHGFQISHKRTLNFHQASIVETLR